MSQHIHVQSVTNKQKNMSKKSLIHELVVLPDIMVWARGAYLYFNIRVCFWLPRCPDKPSIVYEHSPNYLFGPRNFHFSNIYIVLVQLAGSNWDLFRGMSGIVLKFAFQELSNDKYCLTFSPQKNDLSKNVYPPDIFPPGYTLLLNTL